MNFLESTETLFDPISSPHLEGGGVLGAPPNHGVAHGQLLGAAVLPVLAARGLRQRAARPAEAVVEEAGHAAARAPCTAPAQRSIQCFIRMRGKDDH